MAKYTRPLFKMEQVDFRSRTVMIDGMDRLTTACAVNVGTEYTWGEATPPLIATLCDGINSKMQQRNPDPESLADQLFQLFCWEILDKIPKKLDKLQNNRRGRVLYCLDIEPYVECRFADASGLRNDTWEGRFDIYFPLIRPEDDIGDLVDKYRCLRAMNYRRFWRHFATLRYSILVMQLQLFLMNQFERLSPCNIRIRNFIRVFH